MARAIGYVRVSSERQAESGLGLEAQREAIGDAAHRLGLPLAEVFTDAGLSGTLALAERPGLLDAIGALRRGDVLLVARRDRLGRDVVNVALVEREASKRGARVVSAAGEASDLEGPSGVLMRTILDAIGAYERALIAMRTRAALRALRARGQRAGAVPFGHRDAGAGRLEPVVEEQRALVLIRDLREQGRSLRGIAAELTALGIAPKRGARWHASSVRSVVRTAGLVA